MMVKPLHPAALFALGLAFAMPVSTVQAAGGCSNNPAMQYCSVEECRSRQSDVDFYCHGLDQVCTTGKSKSQNQNTLGTLESCLSVRISANGCFNPVDQGHLDAVTWVENQISNCQVIIGQQ